MRWIRACGAGSNARTEVNEYDAAWEHLPRGLFVAKIAATVSVLEIDYALH